MKQMSRFLPWTLLENWQTDLSNPPSVTQIQRLQISRYFCQQTSCKIQNTAQGNATTMETVGSRGSGKHMGGGGCSDDEDDNINKPPVPVRIASSSTQKKKENGVDSIQRDKKIKLAARLELAPAVAKELRSDQNVKTGTATYTDRSEAASSADNSASRVDVTKPPVSPAPVAHSAASVGNEPTDLVSTAVRSPTAASSPDIVIAQVVDEEEIRRRIEHEATIIAGRQLLNSVVTTPQTNDDRVDRRKNKKDNRRACWIIGVVLVALVVGISVAVGVLFGIRGGDSPSNPNENQDPSPMPNPRVNTPSCPFCYNGDAPTLAPIDFNRQVFDALGTLSTCGTVKSSPLPADDNECPLIQAFTWRYCGCPDIPKTFSGQIQCSLCENGRPPTTPGADCTNEAAFVRIVGSWRPGQCPALINEGLENCSCDSETERTPAPTPAQGVVSQPPVSGRVGRVGYSVQWIFLTRNCGGYSPRLDIACGEGAVLEFVNATDHLGTLSFACDDPVDNTISCSSDYDTTVVDGPPLIASASIVCIGVQHTHWQVTATSLAQVGVTCSGTDNFASHALDIRYLDLQDVEFMRDTTCQSDDETDNGICLSFNTCSAILGQSCPANINAVGVTQNLPLPETGIVFQGDTLPPSTPRNLLVAPPPVPSSGLRGGP